MNIINHWIDPEFISATPSRTGTVFNPATGVETAEVAMAARDDVELALAAACRAYESWRDPPLTRRQNIMFAFREFVAKKSTLASPSTTEPESIPRSKQHV